MNEETRRDAVLRHIHDAEGAVARQLQIIKELEIAGHSTHGSQILLDLLGDALRNAREVLALLEKKRTRPEPDQPVVPKLAKDFMAA